MIDFSSFSSLTNNVGGAIVNSLFMILVTEIGDKTFFIAAVLAMRHGRFIVYLGAMGTFSQFPSTSLNFSI
jgi:putative Ca2+/H+ antiporter (TMEM165/GDT1 family)